MPMHAEKNSEWSSVRTCCNKKEKNALKQNDLFACIRITSCSQLACVCVSAVSCFSFRSPESVEPINHDVFMSHNCYHNCYHRHSEGASVFSMSVCVFVRLPLFVNRITPEPLSPIHTADATKLFFECVYWVLEMSSRIFLGHHPTYDRKGGEHVQKWLYRGARVVTKHLWYFSFFLGSNCIQPRSDFITATTLNTCVKQLLSRSIRYVVRIDIGNKNKDLIWGTDICGSASAWQTTPCLKKTVGSRALSFSDPYFHFTCLSVRHSVVLSVRNFGAKYLGNEAR